jgi:hypothetical protein
MKKNITFVHIGLPYEIRLQCQVWLTNGLPPGSFLINMRSMEKIRIIENGVFQIYREYIILISNEICVYLS